VGLVAEFTGTYPSADAGVRARKVTEKKKRANEDTFVSAPGQFPGRGTRNRITTKRGQLRTLQKWWKYCDFQQHGLEVRKKKTMIKGFTPPGKCPLCRRMKTGKGMGSQVMNKRIHVEGESGIYIYEKQKGKETGKPRSGHWAEL